MDVNEVDRLERVIKKELLFSPSIDIPERRELLSIYSQMMDSDLETFIRTEQDIFLWKNVFYRFIEAHRKNIKIPKISSSDKIVASLQSLIDEAIGFYVQVLFRHDHDNLSLIKSRNLKHDMRASNMVRLFVFKTLIIIGDLHRYKALYSTVQDYQGAIKYYSRASKVQPDIGTPFNQLAVISTYNRNNFDAAYFYSRSLLAEVPFPTARKNLYSLLKTLKIGSGTEGEILQVILLSLEKKPIGQRNFSPCSDDSAWFKIAIMLLCQCELLLKDERNDIAGEVFRLLVQVLTTQCKSCLYLAFYLCEKNIFLFSAIGSDLIASVIKISESDLEEEKYDEELSINVQESDRLNHSLQRIAISLKRSEESSPNPSLSDEEEVIVFVPGEEKVAFQRQDSLREGHRDGVFSFDGPKYYGLPNVRLNNFHQKFGL